MPEPKQKRCDWAGSDPQYRAYHDSEWGVPVHDDRTLFEFLILEGAQAGLSWSTILRKRDRYREVFGGFDPEKVARIIEEIRAYRAEREAARGRGSAPGRRRRERNAPGARSTWPAPAAVGGDRR